MRLPRKKRRSAEQAQLPLILQATGDLDGAMRLHQEEEAICRRLNDPAGLATSLANQAHLQMSRL